MRCWESFPDPLVFCLQSPSTALPAAPVFGPTTLMQGVCLGASGAESPSKKNASSGGNSIRKSSPSPNQGVFLVCVLCFIRTCQSKRGRFPLTSDISLGDIWYAPTRWVLALFLGCVKFWSNALKFRLFGGGFGTRSLCGGGRMCILFEICEKRPLQKCMGWGWVDGHVFEQTEMQIGRCTRRSNALGTTDYSESESSSLLPPSTMAGAPLGHTSPCL